LRAQAEGILACDFFVAVTASFRVLYVFLVMEVGIRRIIQCNVTAHPTADWTLQQFRECISGDKPYRFLIHDRDSIYSPPPGFRRSGYGPENLKDALPRAPSECVL
jgi:hypothetical protein